MKCQPIAQDTKFAKLARGVADHYAAFPSVLIEVVNNHHPNSVSKVHMQIINFNSSSMAWVYLIGHPLKILGRIVQTSGAILVIIGAFMFTVLGVGTGFKSLTMFFGFFLGGPVVYASGLLTMSLSKPVFLLGKKLTAKRAEVIMEQDPRDPVLFLRSFKDDKVMSQVYQKHSSWLLEVAFNFPGVPNDLIFSSATTEEEMLANELKRIGPCIAVGSPGERLPPIGMARLYFDKGKWETGVQQWMERADLVVMRAGITDGFLRELRMTVTFLNPKRLLILLPFDTENEQIDESNEQYSYVKFREIANSILPKPLPESSGGKMAEGSLSGIIWFESDWTPKTKSFGGGTITEVFEPSSKRYAHDGVFRF